MYKAYDTILDTEVLASEVASVLSSDSDAEPYRYECCCCGEEVRIAAVGSVYKQAHFRHRRENNNVDCEQYLGGMGQPISGAYSRKSKSERIDFIFDNVQKTFSVTIAFNEDEIKNLESRSAKISVDSSTSTTPLTSIPVNRTYFSPDFPTLLPLESFSQVYQISNSSTGLKRDFKLFSYDKPTLFKFQAGGSEHQAKHVSTSILYTKTKYIAISPVASFFDEIDRLQENGLNIVNKYTINTMKRTFAVIEFEIERKTDPVLFKIGGWGFRLDAPESITLLWPPVQNSDGVDLVSTNEVFISSSFPLRAHGNINLESNAIAEINQGISEILVPSQAKIFRKNAEAIIEISTHSIPSHKPEPVVEYRAQFEIPDTGVYYLIDRETIDQVPSGALVLLTTSRRVLGFKSNYMIHQILPEEPKQLSLEERIRDALRYTNKIVPYNGVVYLDHDAELIDYFDQCKISGLINASVQKIIEDEKNKLSTPVG